MLRSRSDASSLWNEVKGAVARAELNITRATTAITAETKAWTQALTTALAAADFTPHNYHPPVYRPPVGMGAWPSANVTQTSAVFLSTSSVSWKLDILAFGMLMNLFLV